MSCTEPRDASGGPWRSGPGPKAESVVDINLANHRRSEANLTNQNKHRMKCLFSRDRSKISICPKLCIAEFVVSEHFTVPVVFRRDRKSK